MTGGDDGAEPDSQGPGSASQQAVDAMPASQEGPVGGTEGYPATMYGFPPSAEGITPDSANTAAGCDMAVVTASAATAAAAAAVSVEELSTLTTTKMAAVVEGDRPETPAMAMPPTGVAAVSAAGVELEASLQATTFTTPARRGERTEEDSKEQAATTAVVDAERGSRCQVLYILRQHQGFWCAAALQVVALLYRRVNVARRLFSRSSLAVLVARSEPLEPSAYC